MVNGDDQRVTLPVAHGMAHPDIRRRRIHRLEMNGATGTGIFERHLDLVRALHDLERIRHVHRPGDAWHVTTNLRIAVQPVLTVLLLFGGRLRFVRNYIAVDNAWTWRHPADRTQGEHRRGEYRNVWVYARLGHGRPERVRQQVPIGSRRRLPDAVEIRLAGEACRPRSLPGGPDDGKTEHGGHGGAHQDNRRA